ncbi:hypothetical protein PF005_g5506 [Phytophthora fragariae]|uniref:Uncharacterized protein n=1 Tax=Phytophthora fragariae TaxID=53985 RepID=A0A6A3LXD0_9STRA|nr:hypothetical protein PF009_g6029 [Phytophthora fragariae]KAE9022778.1 hypothetical protein PF011_g4299 [Phytophthora fragariae]KAE9151462.1 hypothetical protein PF006_g4248 [Phytophthora fragariae]KAE9225465.1 hypothetical protein PF005_g5506 [Phytophthora fragariae]KAE9248606.1 hypothetical protein PF002_g5697 [Phytophthora fragariae]
MSGTIESTSSSKQYLRRYLWHVSDSDRAVTMAQQREQDDEQERRRQHHLLCGYGRDIVRWGRVIIIGQQCCVDDEQQHSLVAWELASLFRLGPGHYTGHQRSGADEQRQWCP